MAKGITEATVEEVKARVDLADLIASYGIAVKSAGATKKACCPFHHEKTPSFNINESKGFYHCFGCGESGDAIKFVMKMDGLTFVEAVKKLAEQVGVKIEERDEDPAAIRRRRLYALLAELAQFYHRCLVKAKEGEAARAYLRSRALDEKVQADYLIGYAPVGVANIHKWAKKYGYSAEEVEAAGVIRAPTRPGDAGYHRFAGRLMFTIRDKQGRIVGFSGRQLVASKNSGKYVNSPETPVFSKKRILYGFDKALRAITADVRHEVIVCEGQIDCIRLQTSGFPNAVAGQGTAFTDEHVQMLSKAADLVTLVYDDDGAGHKATIKSARLCLAAGLAVRVVSLPNGDDPDSFLRTHPADEFRAMLANAESIMSFQVRAGRAAEPHPETVDAVARITHELLVTVAQCPNEVLKAAMTGEAAKLLGLPTAALNDELRKLATSPAPTRWHATTEDRKPETDEPPEELPPDEVADEPPMPGEEASSMVPPPARELAFCEFLMGNEYDSTLNGMVGEFLPPNVFDHDFTRRFVDTWREEVVCGKDLLAPWSETLSPVERTWFERLLLGQGKTQASGLSSTDVCQDFVRALWADALRRRRGLLPASGDDEADLQRMKLSADIKRFSSLRWPSVKDLIRDYLETITGDNLANGAAREEPS